MFSPMPLTTVFENDAGCVSSHDRNSDPESDHIITIAIDVHTAFLHADVDQDFFLQNHQNQTSVTQD